ncbi:MAG TPA: hypothetical protein DHU96_23780 [Actinobacteria bacterium]|nr:hypothetical protein [Actinomycetota bacterium]
MDADLREPARILAEAARTLDFQRPVAVVPMAVLQSILGEDEAPVLPVIVMAGA